MRIIDESGTDIESPDLENGYLVPTIRIRPDADPIDNVIKHVWADDDYEQVQMYRPYTTEEHILKSKARLRETDPHMIKLIDSLVMCTCFDDMLTVFTKAAKDYGSEIIERKEMRDKINELEE